MSVSVYNNTVCKYRLDKLAKVVYLISEDATKNIHIDGGAASIDDIEEEPIAIEVYDINLSDTDELDERYKFTHQLTFSVHGYMNYHDFEGRYFVIVKSVDETYWMLNPMFPCKVTFVYTLDSSHSHTDFTLATASNYPTMRVEGMSHVTPHTCNGYNITMFEQLKLNERRFSMKDGQNHVLYSNDGFKDIVFDKNSQTFSETFDGKNVQHSITFNIKFDDYKSSWHYNLLEFTDNSYAAVILDNVGRFITCGFSFGLRPRFTVTANDDTTPDNIQIQLIDLHDGGGFLNMTSGGTINKIGTTTWPYTTKYNGWECVGENTARYLLKEERDALDNPTGLYAALLGYEERFREQGLNIVSSFTETEEFINSQCHEDNCLIQTSFPNVFTFNTVTCRKYSLISDTDWSISSTASHITVSPSTGEAQTSYEIEICNTLTPTSEAVTTNLTVTYCDKTKIYDVKVVEGNDCFTAGAIFDISANGQYVTIPTQCCVSAVSESSSTIVDINIQSSYIKVYVPQNNDGEQRQFILDVTFCDGNMGEVIINQGIGFERWVDEDFACVNGEKCDVQRKYSGTTADDINTRTNVTRTVNCAPSTDCGQKLSRWVDTSETTCNGGKKYIVQEEQITFDDGETWSNTGNKRLGREIEDPNHDCEGVEELQEWRADDGYICEGTTKYNRLRLYISSDGINWVATNNYKKGTTVIETDSDDCGEITPSSGYTWEDWRASGEYVCDDGNKYEKLRRYVSNDDVSTSAEVTTWIATDIYKKGALIEANSTDCGYDPILDGKCKEYRDDGSTICDGFNKYKYLKLYYRECEDCNNCSSEWSASSVYKIGELIQANSIDCGYVPSDNYFEWREEGYTCNGFDKYTKYRKYISDDGNNWYQTDIFKTSDQPIAVNSEDCGYVPTIEYEYQWVLSTNTRCVGTTKYYLYKKQRRRQGTSDAWQDVVPTQYSIDGEGTQSVVIAESQSTDCGYTPPIEPRYRWVTMDINNYWICGDCDETPDEMPKIEYREVGESAQIQSAACDSSSTISSSDYGGKNIAYAKVGTCVTTIGEEAFMGKRNLSEVMIPSSVTSIGDKAFSGCSGLVDFSLPMSIERIGKSAFTDCIQINKVSLPNSLRTLDDGAFGGCKNLSSINLPSGIAMVSMNCFYECDGLTDVYVPENVVLLRSYCFGNCSGLVNATFYATEPPAIYQTSFSGVNQNLKIYVPAESVEAYKTAWSNLADKIVAIGS